jgi:outer membrane cobalamin receptor
MDFDVFEHSTLNKEHPMMKGKIDHFNSRLNPWKLIVECWMLDVLKLSVHFRARHTFLGLFIILLFPMIIQAQSMGSIRGQVLDSKTGKNLSSANVMIQGTVLGASTDASGRFVMERIPAGTYRVYVSMMGYGAKTVEDVLVRSGETTELSIMLDETVVAMDPIIVTASKHAQALSHSPQAVTVIPHARIRERHIRKMEEALNDVPGIHFNEDNISIRGSSSWSAFNIGSRVLLLIDGVPFMVSDIGGISWDMMPLMDIQRIEVVKGAGSALYGSAAMGGVINIITQESSPRGRFQVRTVAGLYDDPHYDVWQWTEKSLHYEGVDLAYSRQIGRVGFRVSVSRYVSTGYMENNETDRWNVSGKIAYRLPNNSKLELYGSWTQADKGGFIQWLDQNSPFEVPEYNKEDAIQFKITNLYATYHLPLSARFNLKFRLSSIFSLAGNQLTTLDSGEFDPSHGPGGEIQATWIPLKNHMITMGSEFRWDISGAEYFGTHEGYSISPYIQDEWTLLPNLRTTMGLRIDNHTLINEKSDTRVSPKFGVNYRLFDSGPIARTILRASLGAGFRAASVFEKYIEADYSGLTIIPNPDLRSERSWSSEIGIKQNILTDHSLELSIFQNDVWDMIEAVRDILGTIQFQNYVRARIRGLECAAESWWWQRRFCVRGNITWLDPMNLEFDEILPYRPKVSYLVSGTLHLKPVMLQAEYRYASRIDRVELNPLDPRVPLKLLNLRAQVQWKWLTLQLAVHNALNYHYAQIERRMGEIRNGSITLLMDI